MNSEYSTPARSQQHSPVPLTNQQLASVCADIQLATPAVYGLAPLDLPPSAVDVSHAHLAYLKNAYPGRPYSPSTMDFAGMNIATGYPTPHSATPVGMQSQAAHPQVSLEGTAVGAAAPAAASQTPSAEKPDFSYASLIAQSLVDAPMQRRTLNGIYEWIQEHFPYYRTRQNWQPRTRHPSHMPSPTLAGLLGRA
ncbi:Forkhead box protein L1, partial [Coemansia sp. RSA 2618]